MANEVFLNEDQLSDESRGTLTLDNRDWASIREATLDVIRVSVDDVWYPPPWESEEIQFEICGSLGTTDADAILLGTLGYGQSEGADSLLLAIDRFSTVQVVFERSKYPEEIWKGLFEKLHMVRHEVQIDGVAEVDYIFAVPFGSDSASTDSYKLLYSTYDLADEINLRAENLRFNVPKVQIGNDCGGGEVSVNIQIEDAGARVWRISGFHYKLCEVRGIDPQSRTICPGWSEITGQRSLLAAGWVQFFVVWSDGETSMTRTNITNAMFDESLKILR